MCAIFPLGLDPASLRVQGEGAARILIGSIDARQPAPQPVQSTPERERKALALRDQLVSLDDKIAAATVHKDFARRFATDAPLGLGDKGDARPFAEWLSVFKAVEEEIGRADENIRALQGRKREVEAEIAVLNADQRTDPPLKMEVRIDLAAEAATTGNFRISYSVRDARWQPLYDARLETGARDSKPSLEVVRRAEIVQRTGENWSNVTLAVSTVRTGRGGNAPNLNSLIVRYPQYLSGRSVQLSGNSSGGGASGGGPPRGAPSGGTPGGGGAGGSGSGGGSPVSRAENSGGPGRQAIMSPPMPAMEMSEERGSVVESGGFQALFRIPGRVSLGAGEGARSMRIASTTVVPALLVRAAPMVNDAAYLEASFKQNDEAPLLPGRVSLYRDGTFIGRGQMMLAQKEETVKLGFGVDELVKVERSVLHKSESASGILTSSKVDEREYKITMRNGHVTSVDMMIEEAMPVTENAEIQVEMLQASTQPTARDIRDQRGVMAWTVSVPPGETRDIKFGWRVRWPADKSVVFSPTSP